MKGKMIVLMNSIIIFDFPILSVGRPPSHLERNRKYMDRFMLRWCHHCEELNRAPLSHERGILTVPKLAKRHLIVASENSPILGFVFRYLTAHPARGFLAGDCARYD